jgi:hypothetical protein
MRTTAFQVALLTGALAVAGCSDRSVPSAPRPSAPVGSSGDVRDDEKTNDLPLVVYRISASSTDAAITFRASYTPGGDDARHYAWLDPSAKSNHRLFVFMPATNEIPATYQRIGEEAARLGYHVIGLMYQNEVKLADECGKLGSNAADCYLKARREIIDGTDRGIPEKLVVKPANGIENRLTKLLQYLNEQHPAEGWSSYLDGASPRWKHIAVGGHSQGGGQAAVIAKYWRVDRVVMFSAVPDSVGAVAPDWLSTHATPSNRYFGLAHAHERFLPPILAGWDSLGMRGSPVAPEDGEPPYGGTQMLVTALEPRTGGYAHMPSHHSTASDKYTQLDASGAPVLLDAWRYLMGGSIWSEMAEGRSKESSDK